jgi:hypothetical protein
MYPIERIIKIHKKAIGSVNEFYFEWYKFYWNHHTADIYLYPNYKHPNTNNLITEEDSYLYMKVGIDRVIDFLRNFI